ncbi:hypothetical protein NFI96_000402 [Prochilodus magdalenae]|nr:hypothetical protein NFI96_000402 [Prochilodus magdalenae]
MSRTLSSPGPIQSQLLLVLMENMAVEIILLLTLVSVSLVNAGALLSLDCLPADGVIGGPTEISCSFRKRFTDQSITITAVTVTKRGETDPVFQMNGEVQGESRFNLPSREDPSLQITNTAVSDEGLYEYVVVTNRGIIPDGTFRISVTANYSSPSITARSEKIVDGGPAEFHCSASGGYPAGTIHWFDGTGTNWTNNATLEITEGEDKLVHLSSRLSFTKIDSNWGRFRCEVLNSRFTPEGESTFTDTVIGDPDSPSTENVGSTVAGVLMVVVVIIVGLLLVVLYRKRRTQSGVPGGSGDVEANEADTPTLLVHLVDGQSETIAHLLPHWTLPHWTLPHWTVLNMAVEMVLLMVLVCVSLVNSQDGGIRVDCPPAVGVVGETTEISCSFRKRFPDQSITITAVTVTKRDKGPVFRIKEGEKKGDHGDRGDTRFKLPSREDPSLQITNTALSDEGLYDYLVVTDRGTTSGTFWISVTGPNIVDCQSADGVVGQTTEISCSLRKSFTQSVTITGVTVTKIGATDPVFWIRDGTPQGDPRFNLPSREDPSLQITNTAVSDEGLYKYVVQTNRGPASGTFRISVTAKYHPPSTSTRPEKIVDGGPAEFHCSASGGYPAGTIHWFDGTRTNWTNSATLEITEGEDKLVHLSSRLSFTKIDSDWGRFRCEVLNSRFITEGESTFREAYRGDPDPPSMGNVSAITGVVVICVIIVGLLLVLLYLRRRSQRNVPEQTDPDPAETEILHPPVNPTADLSCPQFSMLVLRQFLEPVFESCLYGFRVLDFPRGSCFGLSLIPQMVQMTLPIRAAARSFKTPTSIKPVSTPPAHSCYSSYRELELWMDVMGECLCCLTLFKEPLQSDPSKELFWFCYRHPAKDPNSPDPSLPRSLECTSKPALHYTVSPRARNNASETAQGSVVLPSAADSASTGWKTKEEEDYLWCSSTHTWES